MKKMIKVFDSKKDLDSVMEMLVEMKKLQERFDELKGRVDTILDETTEKKDALVETIDEVTPEYIAFLNTCNTLSDISYILEYGVCLDNVMEHTIELISLLYEFN